MKEPSQPVQRGGRRTLIATNASHKQDSHFVGLIVQIIGRNDGLDRSASPCYADRRGNESVSTEALQLFRNRIWFGSAARDRGEDAGCDQKP